MFTPMFFVMGALTVLSVVAMAFWLTSSRNLPVHEQLLPDGSKPNVAAPRSIEQRSRDAVDSDAAADDHTDDVDAPAGTDAADLVKSGTSVTFDEGDDEAATGVGESSSDATGDDEPTPAEPPSGDDIHVEGAGEQLDQDVYDQMIADGKSERMARSRAKAAWIRAQKKTIMAEQEAGANDDDISDGDDDTPVDGDDTPVDGDDDTSRPQDTVRGT